MEWSTKAVRDAVFASPQFTRLLDAESVKETIARGVEGGLFAYVGKRKGGKYDPFCFKGGVSAGEVEISDEMFIITAEEAKKHIEPPKLTSLVVSPEKVQIEPGKRQTFVAKGLDQHGRDMAIKALQWKATGGSINKDGVFLAEKDEGNFIVTVSVGEISGTSAVTVAKPGTTPIPTPTPGTQLLLWSGEVPPQKWMNFYTKVLSRFAAGKGLKLTVSVEVKPEAGLSEQQVEETRVALRELGLKDDVGTR